MSIMKFENIIPIEKNKVQYAYQCENINHIIKLEAYLPGRAGKEEYPNTEKDKVFKYELEIQKLTGNSITICLEKIYKAGEMGVKSYKYVMTMSFAEFVNQIFRDRECSEYEEK